MTIREIQAYNNKKPIEFVIKENFRLIEDQAYIPRFKLKDIYQIADVPVNEPMKVTEALIIKGIDIEPVTPSDKDIIATYGNV